MPSCQQHRGAVSPWLQPTPGTSGGGSSQYQASEVQKSTAAAVLGSGPGHTAIVQVQAKRDPWLDGWVSTHSCEKYPSICHRRHDSLEHKKSMPCWMLVKHSKRGP
jgi:hypothetical protein